MPLHLQFRRYRLPFRTPVRTAHGLWAEREGLLVRLTDAAEGAVDAVGWGEAAPIPWFGTETADLAEAALRDLGEWVEPERLADLPAGVPGVRQALQDARADLARATAAVAGTENATAGAAESAAPKPYLGVAALLPAGRPVLAAIGPKAEAGFRVFKWKVGVGDVADELALLDDVCAALPSGAKLRLDANGALDRRRAERWLERCADRPVEFLEQPIAPETRGADDVLLGLAGDFPTPLALDESLVGGGDVERWLGAGWPGIFVVKPLLLGDADAALAALAKAKAEVVFSSALETAVGAKAALRRALAWSGAPRALGFGVWPLFADARCDGPYAAPFIRAEDVARLDPEAVWNALS